MWIAIVCGLVLALLLAAIFLAYRRFLTHKNAAEKAMSELSALLKKRYVLLGGFLSAMRDEMSQERALLKEISSLRSLALMSDDFGSCLQLDGKLSNALKSLFDKHYPKSNDENFNALKDELIELDTKISAQKELYSQAAAALNCALDTIPTNIIAAILKQGKMAI